MKYYKRILFIYLLIISLPIFAKQENIKNKEDSFEVRVAVVDIQTILEGSIAIQNLRKIIGQFNQKIQQDILNKEAEFKPLEEKLIKERHLLSELDFENQVNAFNVKVSKVKKEIQDRKTRLEQAHAEAMGMIHEMTITIISELAEKYNLNLVIPNTQILYAKNNLNITAEVTFILNKRLKDVTVNY